MINVILTAAELVCYHRYSEKQNWPKFISFYFRLKVSDWCRHTPEKTKMCP